MFERPSTLLRPLALRLSKGERPRCPAGDAPQGRSPEQREG